METLPLDVLDQIAQARGLDTNPTGRSTRKLTRNQLLPLLAQSTPAHSGPFGVDLTAPLFEQTLQLRMIPLSYLVRDLQQRGLVHGLVDAPTYKDIIQIIVGRGLDQASEDVLTYYTLSVERLRQISGSSAKDKVTLIRQILQPTSSNQLSKGPVSAVTELTRAGFSLQPLVSRPLQPLPAGFSLSPTANWTSDNLLAAVQQGYDVSQLLAGTVSPQSPPIGVLTKMDQALAGLGVILANEVNITGQPKSIRERYQDTAEQLQLYSQYPVAAFWPQIYLIVQKLYPSQRRVVLQEFGLAQPGDNLTEAQVFFMFSHGAAAPGTYQLSPEVAAALAKRGPGSKMESTLVFLDRIQTPNQVNPVDSNPDLVIAAAKFGIKLPWQRPKEALVSTIFLYEWLDPQRDLLAVTLPQAKTSAELLAVLRKYDDFELSAIWPGFTEAPRDRRALLQQLLQQLPRLHFTTAINCGVEVAGQSDDPLNLVETSFGLPNRTAQCWSWSQLINLDNASLPRDRIFQLARALSRNESEYAPNQEDVVVSYLVATAFNDVTIQPLDPNLVDTEAIRLVLTSLFQLGELAFGWDGISDYKIERDQAKVELLPLAQNNLIGVLGNPGAIPPAGLASYRFNNEAKPVADVNDLAALLALAQAAPVEVLVDHSITMIQTAYIYMGIWFGEKLLLNPFVFGA